MSERYYSTTFTPEEYTDVDKRCPSCKETLNPKKFNSRKGVRNGNKGTIRSKYCLKCEKSERHERERTELNSYLQTVNTLSLDNEKMRNELDSQRKNVEDLKNLVNILLAQNAGITIRIDSLEKLK